MAKTSPSPQAGDDEFGAQRTIRRSRLFFVFPVIAIAIFAFNLIWEVVRHNMDQKSLTSWPFRFSMVDTSTTANILVLATGLLIARLQYARVLRPVIGFSIDDADGLFKPDSDQWRFWLFNAGPGTVVVERFEYYVEFKGDEDAGRLDMNDSRSWVPLAVVNDQLRSRGLKDGEDYFLRWNTKGAPVPPASSYKEGGRFAWFTIRGLAELERFDVRIQVMDGLGDIHERTFPFMHRLPSVTEDAIKAFRTRNPRA
ncbi:hypothetical protein [Planotetraspora mira]|uniref:Uncharacterized protein n=1 Tax=Planotetraspora mira TaxID=58121 RepID=A0A8J3TMZ8_9ACTN|nr:hypothetical protein [Planotetraspora mira]GII28786.1 hypothetical protein Pmi06nite_22280 [Planotetraspora mira]